MNIRQTLATAAALAVAGGLVAAAPGQAATTGSTAVTFQIPAAELSITVPSATATLTYSRVLTGGATIAGSLGATTVSDERTALVRTFTVTATSSGFTSGATTIPGSKAAMSLPASGSGAPVWSNATSAALPVNAGINLGGSGQPFLVGAVAAGVGSVTYNPVVTISLTDADIVPGTYNGSITQTAA